MNIAFFSESYKPYLSGVTVSVETLYKELKKLNHQVSIFAPAYPNFKDTKDHIFRFPSIHAGYPGFRIAFPYVPRILKALSKLNLNIIHSHSPWGLGLASLRWARRQGLPYVYTYHTIFTEYVHYFPFLPPWPTKNFVAWYIKNFCNKCDTVIVPTEGIKSLLLERGVKSPIQVIPTGVDFEALSLADGGWVREKYRIEKGTPLLLHVGRLSKEKNVPFLLRAFRKVVERVPQAYLMIVAGGPKEEEYKRLAQDLGVAGKTIFTSQVKHKDVFHYYKAADIFVFSSLTETQGLVLCEAKAAGLPIVAIGAQGVSNVVIHEEDGFLVPAEIESFVQKVVLLLEDRNLRKKMGERAKADVHRDFSPGAMAKKVETVYKSLLR